METSIKASIVIIMLIVVAVGGTYLYTTLGPPSPASCRPPSVIVNNACVGPTGSTNYQTSITYTDQLSGGACTCTGVTNKNLYHLNGVWPITTTNQLAGAAATALSTSQTAITVYPQDGGYLGLWSDSGITTDYVVPVATKATNQAGLITDFALLSLDNSGNLQILFRVNFGSIPGTPSSSGTAGPSVPITIKTLSDDDVNLAIAATPPSQLGIGTGTKIVTVTWYLGYASNGNLANNKGYTIGRILIGSNETTFEANVVVTQVTISYAGTDPYVGTAAITATGVNIVHNSGAKQWEIILPVAACNENLAGATPSGCTVPPSTANVNFRQEFTNIFIGHKQGDPGQISVTVTFQTAFTATGVQFGATLKIDASRPNNVLITQLTNLAGIKS